MVIFNIQGSKRVCVPRASQNFTVFGENLQPHSISLVQRLGNYTADVGTTQQWVAKNSCLAIKVKGPTRRKLEELIRGRRKIDRCQEDAGLGVTRKMGLIPLSIPAAFLLFEVTSGLDFPL